MPLIETARWVTILLVCAVLAFAGANDVRDRRIPNWTVAATIMLFGAWVFVDPSVSLMSSVVAAFLVFVGSCALYAFGIIGAGDSKLVTAVTLFAGLAQLPQFMIYMSLTGGMLVLCMLVAKPARILVLLQMRGRGSVERGVPYGVAIAVAGAMLLLTPAAQRLF